MSVTKLNPEHLMLLEQATLKAPADTLRKSQRVTQKTYEHNLGPTSSFSKDLTELLSSTPVPSEESQAERLKTLDGMLAKMRGLKRKLVDLSTQSNAGIEGTRTRIQHLASLPPSLESPSYAPWARKRLSNHIAEHFMRSDPPLRKSAMCLAKEEDVEDLMDFSLWDELAKAEEGLRAGRLEEVLAWVGENRSALRKAKSPLEFRIHLQAYIELCRQRDLAPAIAYVKKSLLPAAVAMAEGESTAHMDELNRAMALLAFGPSTTCIIYHNLYSPSRWTHLLSLFRSTFLSLHSLSSLPLLHLSLQAGLASLKTPICVPLDPAATEGTPSPECPICSSPLRHLAAEVPYSHHVNSTIVCSLTGKVVEGGGGDAGGLVAMISKVSGEGRVYSKEALLEIMSMSGDKQLHEPTTDELFKWDDLKKVFIS